MYFRAIRNDIMNSKSITATTMLFVSAAAMLVGMAAVLIVELSGAIDTLMTRAKTPHFMQMHAGTIDIERLTKFAEEHDAVDSFQVVEFLNVDAAQIMISGRSLSGSVQDNGFAVQGESFDFLLDLDGNVIEVTNGEVYVPVTYMRERVAAVGDTVAVADRQFVVAGFLRDSQMNSLLSSSKRFLVSRDDFATLREIGIVEYLIEFRLHDPAALNGFETDYTAAGLESNGPTITYPLFRMLNGLSDGLMIAVILLVSILVVAVSFLCIRFTLLAKIEDDYTEIGVMKGIGLRVSDIKKLYLAKYAAIAALGCVLGYSLSLAFRDALLTNIRLFMGESGNASLAPLLGVVGVMVVFLAIVAYVNVVLRRFRRISPAQAIRFGVSRQNSGGGRRLLLHKTRYPGTNVFLGLKDVISRMRLYATMLAVLVVAAFIISVPQNLYNTVAAKSFVTYMGVGRSDLRLDIQQTDRIATRTTEVAAVMAEDDDIARFVVLTTKTFSARMDDGSVERIKVELGDHSVFPLTYSTGRAPAQKDEIALSIMQATDMGKDVGDTLYLVIDGMEQPLVVSGIYSDVTNGGKTAKAVFSAASDDAMWSVISAELADPSLIEAKVAEYAGRFEFAKVSDIDEFIVQTYGTTISSIGKAALASLGVALAIALLITLLFMRMMVKRDRYSIALMKAIGFRNSDIRVQYVTRATFVLVAGIVLGTVLANTLGESLAGAVIGSFGATGFDFVIHPLFAYLLNPLLLAVTTLSATMAATLNAGRIDLAKNIKE